MLRPMKDAYMRNMSRLRTLAVPALTVSVVHDFDFLWPSLAVNFVCADFAHTRATFAFLVTLCNVAVRY